MHHIFVYKNNINDNIIKITNENDNKNFCHLKTIRLNLNEKILVSVIPFTYTYDYLCVVKSITEEMIILEIAENIESRELNFTINLFQGIPKSDKFEFIIEKAVELGVNNIIPVNMDFSIAKISKESKIERYNNIALSASEQSKRNIIPSVSKPINYIDMINEIKNSMSIYNALFYEKENDILKTKKFIDSIDLKKNKIINIVIGPEGGFSDKEIKLAKDNGIEILSLGKRILRTETASIVALSIIMYRIECI